MKTLLLSVVITAFACFADIGPAEHKEKLCSGDYGLQGYQAGVEADDGSYYIAGSEWDFGDEPYENRVLPAQNDRQFDNGSGITIPFVGSTRKLVNNLDLLGKIWGFMKYHHPEVGKGNYNWDYELLRILPDYIQAKNIRKRDKILLGWINKYGDIPPVNPKETDGDAFLKPDFSWIDRSNISKELKDKIVEIYQNRHQGDHYYIRMFPLGNPEFLNENAYPDMPYPDAGFRLLSLFRYWNMIRYFFPYTYLTDKDWNDVLREYIPDFINARDELEYEVAVLRLIGEVHDTHANLWGGKDRIDALRGGMKVPFRVQFIEGMLTVTDYYNPELKFRAGLEIGDVVTHINGRSVKVITDSLRCYYPASNYAAKLRDIADDLLRSPEKTIGIKYLSGGVEKETALELYPTGDLNIYRWFREDKNEKCYKFITPEVGYVTLATINQIDVFAIKRDFRDTKGIIIDLRNYPSAFVPFLLGSYFVSETTSFVKFTQGNTDNPGEFTFREGQKIAPGRPVYQGMLVVLVNENSQSQAEYTAMAFRAGDNTTVIGSMTAGADGNVSTIMLPGGLRTMISGKGVYYPEGGETQRIGIIPDIVIEPTIKGIAEGRDEVLEKAIEVIMAASVE